MTDKTKRKVNPRRRLLFRLIFGIGVLVTLIASGVYLLRPTGAQIVFVAPDDNGVDNIWIADLDNPENPRIVTDSEQGRLLSPFHVSETGYSLLYRIGDGDTRGLWRVNLNTGRNERVLPCDVQRQCDFIRLHSDGEWLAYLETIEERHNNEWHMNATMYVLNMETSNTYVVGAVEDTEYTGYRSSPMPQWLGQTDTLMFRSNYTQDVPEPYTFYHVEENRIVETRTLDAWFPWAEISDNGAYYVSGGGIDLSAITVREINNPEYIIATLTRPIEWREDHLYYIIEWHPDNERVLLLYQFNFRNPAQGYHELILYDVFTGNHETLIQSDTGHQYLSSTFNHDGSQLLFIDRNEVTSNHQIMIYDMETGELNALPLSGYSPHWVNGGR